MKKKNIAHSLIAAAVLFLAGTGLRTEAAPAKLNKGDTVVGYYLSLIHI